MHFQPSTHSRRKVLIQSHGLPPAFHPDGRHAMAIVSLRISPRPQPGELSLEKQEAEVLEWCERRQLTVVAIYIDDKVSGRKRVKRRGFNAAIEHAKEIQAVLVGHSLSRFARSVKDMLAINDELAEAGLSFATATGPPVDTTTASGRLMLNMWASIHQYFAEFHAEQTRDALRWRKEHGRVYCHRTPFGWGRRNKRFWPIEREQKIIRWAVWRLRLGFATTRLYKELQARRWFGFRDRQVTVQMLRQIEQRFVKDQPDYVPPGAHPLDEADLHIARMAEAGTVGTYTNARWSRATRILVIPRGLLASRQGEWPHKKAWTELVDGPVMDREGYLTVSLDELREIRRRAHKRLRENWPLVPESQELLEKLCVVRQSESLVQSFKISPSVIGRPHRTGDPPSSEITQLRQVRQ